MTFYEETYLFTNQAAIDSGIPSSISVGETLMSETGASQDRCCQAGIQLGRDDLIQACLVPDGDEEKQLELNDMNECIERDVQPMRYQQANGSPVEGYAPTS